MPKLITILVAFCFLIIAINPNLILAQNYQLTQVATFGEDESNDIFFSGIIDVEFDDEGNLYVADWADYTITKIDAGGNLIQQVGAKGQGPGEFDQAPRSLVITKDQVVLATLFKIHYFDKDLNYQEQLPLFETAFAPLGMPLEMTYLDGQFVYTLYSKPALEMPSLLYAGDIKNNELKPIEVDYSSFPLDSPREGFIASLNATTIHRGQNTAGFAVLFPFQNRVDVFGDDLVLKTSFSVPELSQKPIFSDLEGRRQAKQLIENIVLNGEDECWIQDRKGTVYITDSAGGVKQKIDLAGEKIWAIYDGFLYSSKDENTVIVKRKILES